MGRHSAPADDEDDMASAPALSTAAADAADRVGRHSGAPPADEVRPNRLLAPGRPRRPSASAPATSTRPETRQRPRASAPSAVTGPMARIPPELPVERTLSIAAVEAEIAADADAADAPVLDVAPVADLAPIRPGEAIRPPRPGGLSALHDLLDAGSDPAVVDAGADRAADTAAPPVSEADVADPAVVVVPDALDAPSEPDEPVASGAPIEPVLPAHGGNTSDGGRTGSAADLALLRSDSTLLARCLAGLLAPFLVYVVVMVVLGATGRHWLIWIWIPMITAGVLVGAFLDSAHKPARKAEDKPSPVSRS